MPRPGTPVALMFALAICLPAALALTGCSTTEPAWRAAPAPAAAAHNNSDLPRIVTDDAYTAYVERQAASRGISVHWLNKRQKRLPPDPAAPEAE